MVETAFVLFILVMFAFGVTEFGRAMYTKNTLNNAARAGARAAVVTTGLPTTSSTTLVKLPQTDCTKYGTTGDDPVYQAVCNSLFSGITKSQVSVSISGPNNPAKFNDTITVEVDYGTAGQANTGFQSVVPKLILIRNVLTGQASMRYE